jgi:hypothetical protein
VSLRVNRHLAAPGLRGSYTPNNDQTSDLPRQSKRAMNGHPINLEIAVVALTRGASGLCYARALWSN